MMFLLTPSTRLIGSTAASIRRKLLALGVLVMIPVLILGFLASIATPDLQPFLKQSK